MKKALVLAIAVILGLTALAYAGPTISAAYVWFEGDTVLAPGIGYQANKVGMAFECNLHFATLDLATGPDWGIELGSVFDVGVKIPFGGLLEYPRWYAYVGGAFPFLGGMSEGSWGFLGAQAGLLVGFGYESRAGHGVKALLYWSGDDVASALVGYLDLVGLFNPPAAPSE